MSKLVFCAIGVILAIAASKVSADSACWLCTSATDNNCADSFKSTSSMNTCNGAYCLKTMTQSGSSTVFARTCSPIALNDNKCNTASSNGVTVTTCTCQGEKCNSATRGTVTGIAMTAAAGLAIAMTFLVSRRV